MGFEEKYSVSSLGRVWRKGGLDSGGRNWPGRILKGGNVSNYRKVHLIYGDKKLVTSIHRLVATAFLPNPERHPLVRHLNDIRDDNRVVNLAWGTQSDNMKDAVRNGRNRGANLTECKYGHPFDKVGKKQRMCSICQRASHQKALKKARSIQLPLDSPIHGTRNGYNSYACRCEKCKFANTEHQRNFKKKRREDEQHQSE